MCPRTVLNCASGNNIKLLQSRQGQFIFANCLFRASFSAAPRKTSTLSRYSGSTLDTLYIQYALSSIFKPNNMGKLDIYINMVIISIDVNFLLISASGLLPQIIRAYKSLKCTRNPDLNMKFNPPLGLRVIFLFFGLFSFFPLSS